MATCRLHAVVWLVLGLGSATVLAAQPAASSRGAAPAGARSRYSGGGEIDLNGRYVWRGIAYSNGPVVQPYIWAARDKTSVTAWSSMLVGNEADRGKFDQLFVSVSHELSFGRWHFEPAVQGYTWRGLLGDETTRTMELSGRLSRPLGPVTLSTSHTVDIASYSGSWIADAGVEWMRARGRWELESSLTTAFANGRFNRTYVGAPGAAVNDVQFTVGGTRRGSNGWYIRPHAEFVTITAASVRQALETRALANAGVVAGWAF